MDVQTVTPASSLNVPEAAHRLVEFGLWVVSSVVNDVHDNMVDARERQFKADCWCVKSHHLAGTAENSSSMYHSL